MGNCLVEVSASDFGFGVGDVRGYESPASPTEVRAMKFSLEAAATLPRFRLSLLLTVLLAVATTWPTAGRVDAISLQFARTPKCADELLGRWQHDGRRLARQAIYIDFAFLVAYATTLALACAIVARGIRPVSRRWAQIGIVLACGMSLTALFDAAENVAML